eukprot:11069267-Ditylum_brightwellii.AAC.1
MDNENAQVFSTNFCKLFDNQSPLPCDPTALNLINQVEDFSSLNDPISLKEVRDALKQMANGKAAAPSGITFDALKSMVWREEGLSEEEESANDDADFLASVIHQLLLDYWDSKLDFESWKQGILAP